MVTVEVSLAGEGNAILKHEFGGWVCYIDGKLQKSRISTGNKIIRNSTVIFVGQIEHQVREILEVIP
ncbi:MAG: hypothetical protein NTY99_03170 [DPANN group archaeon]|nr:hypothetical protein [DPANN group archaeon]